MTLKSGTGALLAASVFLFCGCPQGSGSKPKAVLQPFRGQEVEFLAPASMRLSTLWDVSLHEWMDQTGATLRWNEYSPDGEDSLEKKLAGPIPGGGRVILFPLAQLSSVDQRLAPMTAGTTSINLKDLFKGLRERVVTRNRDVVAIPLAAPVPLCYYRADLLRAAGLKAPETWEEYQELIDSLDRWAPGLSVVEPLGAGHRATTFFARSLAYVKHPENYSVWFDLASGKPVLETAGFQESITMASRAWEKMPPEILSYSPLDCRNQILSGKAALAIGQEPLSSLKIERKDGIEVGICRLPGSRRVYNSNANRWDTLPQSVIHAPGICGYEGIAIAVGTASESEPETDSAAAWHLLTMLTDDQFESSWSSLPKGPCRESQISVASTWNESGLTAEESSRAVDAMAQMLRDPQLVADIPLPSASLFQQDTSLVLEKLIKKEIDAGEALKQIQAAFIRRATEVGEAKIRADHRRGLGLATQGKP